MADKKISELTALTGANVATDDQLVIVDTSAALTKNITIDEFKNALDTATGFVRITGDTMTGNLSMGDNVKAIFGAGSDLQIYHDGSNSYINDGGIGSLKIRADQLRIESADGSETLAVFNQNSDVFLRHDNTTRLATTSTGVDITGTLTSDGLTVDGSSTLDDIRLTAVSLPAAGNPSIALRNTDNNIYIQSGSGNAITLLDSSQNTMLIATPTSHSLQISNGNAFSINSGRDISFFEDTGTTAKFFWDASAERLGIGTSSPSTILQVTGNSTSRNTIVSNFTLDGGTSVANPYENFGFGINFIGRDYGNAVRNYASINTVMEDKSSSSGGGDAGFETGLSFYTNGGGASDTDPSERMRIDSSGNVGIGTDAPQLGSAWNKVLHIHSSSGSGSHIRLTDPTSGETGESGLYIGQYGVDSYFINRESGKMLFVNNGSEAMRIDSSGNVGIGVTSMVNPLHVGVTPNTASKTSGSAFDGGALRLDGSFGSADAEVGILAGQNDGLSSGIGFSRQSSSDWGTQIKFYTHSPAITTTDELTERMRIDSSGNLLVGKTTSGIGVTGSEILAGGQLLVTADGDNPVDFNRKTSDGTIALFRKDGTTVGSIGVNGSRLTITSDNGSTGGGVRYSSAWMAPTDRLGALLDNTLDCGTAIARWDDIYATNGTIQTSDRNEKQDIAGLTDAEQRVAVAAKGLLRKFRWRDAVEAKGDDARIHVGIIAQDLQAAFAAEGLDAGDYAMFISSTWTDEETGEERTRMGVRYSELLAFIIAAI